MSTADPITSAHLGFSEPTRRQVVTTVSLTHASGHVEHESLTEERTPAGPLDGLQLLSERATSQGEGFTFTYAATKDRVVEDYIEPRPPQ